MQIQTCMCLSVCARVRRGDDTYKVEQQIFTAQYYRLGMKKKINPRNQLVRTKWKSTLKPNQV